MEGSGYSKKNPVMLLLLLLALLATREPPLPHETPSRPQSVRRHRLQVLILRERHGVATLSVKLNGTASSAEPLELTLSCPNAGREVAVSNGVCGCPVGFKLDGENCVLCPNGLSSVAGASTCDVCAAGYYRPSVDTIATQQTCTPCIGIEGVEECPWNGTTDNLILLRGYWRYNQMTDDMYKCISNEATNTTGCPGGFPGSACVEGQSGPKCVVCDVDGFTLDKSTGLCQACPSVVAPTIMLTLGVGLLLLIGWGLRMLLSSTRPGRGGTVMVPLRSFISSIQAIGPSKFKVRIFSQPPCA